MVADPSSANKMGEDKNWFTTLGTLVENHTELVGSWAEKRKVAGGGRTSPGVFMAVSGQRYNKAEVNPNASPGGDELLAIHPSATVGLTECMELACHAILAGC